MPSDLLGTLSLSWLFLHTSLSWEFSCKKYSLGKHQSGFRAQGPCVLFSDATTESYLFFFFCPLLQTHSTMTVSFTEKDRENLPQAHWLGLLSSLYLKARPVVSCLTPELLVEVKRCLSHWVALAPPEIPEGILSLRARELRGAPWGLVTLEGNFLESS